jgi:hypothetical protein
MIEVGNEVYLSTPNLNHQYRPFPPIQSGRPSLMSGIVCSIRDIRTGELRAVASGDLSQYLFEVVDVESFQPQLSSSKNSDRPELKKQLQASIKKLGGAGKLLSSANGTLDAELKKGLDGWRIVKLRSKDLTTQKPSPAQRARKAAKKG